MCAFAMCNDFKKRNSMRIIYTRKGQKKKNKKQKPTEKATGKSLCCEKENKLQH